MTSFIGYHYDIARGAYLRPEIFIAAMQRAANAGFRHFVPYLENMICLPSIADACPSCAYAPETWRKFAQAAAEIGIELVPHFNVIGHAADICAAYPELGGGSHELDPTVPATKAWTRRCLEEFCELSSSEYFLIGGDEWQAPPHLLQRGDLDVGIVWAEQINLATEVLVARQRRPIVWHDMLMHYPQTLELLSRDAVIAFWYYDVDVDYPVLSMLRRCGFRTIMASGICGCTLSRRRAAAAECAIAAGRAHQADGFMITNWENSRWETAPAHIDIIGGLLRGEQPPAAILDAASAIEMADRAPDVSQRAAVEQALRDPVWENYPEHRHYFQTLTTGDVEADRASFSRYHFPQGPLYDRYDRDARPFGLCVHQDYDRGDILRFTNGDESFVVYPKFGASLQNWQCDGRTVIAESLTGFLQRGEPLPGGYRSYTAVGGFRPIWALGTQHNPCILWQDAFAWELVENSAQRQSVRLSRELPHVIVSYLITVETGRSGFHIAAEAVNLLPHAHAAFNFNLPLHVEVDEVTDLALDWGSDVCRLLDRGDSAFWVPCDGAIEMRTAKRRVRVEPETAAAGYFVDWSSTWITPDLHGVYQPVAVGERCRASWHFTT